MKKRPSLKKSKKIKKIKPKKLLKRATYRGTAEARKLKQKWMLLNISITEQFKPEPILYVPLFTELLLINNS